MEKGMCTPMSDRDFFTLMTTNSKGQVNLALVNITLKHYPSLDKYFI